jgi:hypothetical protein
VPAGVIALAADLAGVNLDRLFFAGAAFGASPLSAAADFGPAPLAAVDAAAALARVGAAADLAALGAAADLAGAVERPAALPAGRAGGVAPFPVAPFPVAPFPVEVRLVAVAFRGRVWFAATVSFGSAGCAALSAA